MQDYERAKFEGKISTIMTMMPNISEKARSYLSLRDVGQIRVAKQPYQR